MLDVSSLSQTFQVKLELEEFLPRMQGDGPQTSPTEEGDVTQPMGCFQVPTCSTQEATLGSALC